MTQWQNFFGEDVRQRFDLLNNSSIYEPQPRSLITENGSSLVSLSLFNETIISPILENNLTETIIPLNKIIAMDTNNQSDDLIIINKIRESIKQNTFDFNETRGVIGFELPGNYIIVIGGQQRLTAMFLEHITETKIQINKIKDPSEFTFNGFYNESKIRRAIENRLINARIKELSDGSKKLELSQPLENPLQLFDDTVSDELLDVLAQTL